MPTTTSSNPLWDLQAQYLPGTFQAATDIYNQGAPGYYPGQTVADFDPVKAQGLNLGVDAALGAQTDLANTYATQLGGIAGGTDAYTQQLANQAAGATNFGFGQAGTLGSARHANAASQAAANTIADRQLSALGQIPAAQQAATLPGQTLSQIGGQTQDYAQQLIDADKKAYDYSANQPYNWLNQYQSALAPSGFSAPTTTNEQATGLETATGLVSLLSGVGGLFGFAEGGDTTAAFQQPQGNFGWQTIDGRPQLVAQERTAPNTYGQTGRYTPQQIGYDATGATQLTSSTQGSGGGSGINSANTIVPGTTLTQGQLDAYEDIIAPGGNYDATSDILTPEQQEYVMNNLEAQLAQESIAHSIPVVAGGEYFGYDSIADMFDGGGPGGSGDSFEGGWGTIGILGDVLNSVGVDPYDSGASPASGVHPDSVQQDDGSFDISGWFDDDPAPVASSSK